MKSMIGLCAAAMLAILPVANAQQQRSDETPPATSSKAIPDHKLDAVAKAAKRVVVIGDSYEQKLAKANDGDKEKIVDEANREITKAVNDQGLSVDEYVSIMKVAQDDPSVRDKIVQRLK
jgi:hypothetical protein